MFALTSEQNGRVGARGRGSRALPFSGGFVLPRLLRRPARLVARLWSGEISVPPFISGFLCVALIGSFAVYGIFAGGHVPSLVQAVTARTGFAISEIRVSGNRETSEIDIFDRVGLDGWTSLVGFDAGEARKRIVSLPWVESATVRKIYPETLEVKVVEKVPFAIWQQGSLLSLIEKNGEIIAPLSGSDHLVLPLVVGAGAPVPAASFIAMVAAYPEIAPHVRGYVRVAGRRWNLRFDSNMTVKLPEAGEARALSDLQALERRYGLLSRDVESIDMRFDDRLVVRLTPNAAATRETALKTRLGKNYRPAERDI